MQIHRDIDRLPAFRNAVITIGTFDGVHLGHRRIIDKLKTEAGAAGGETVIITFHPHPRKVVSSAILGIRLLNTLDEKIELLELLSIDHLVIVPFTDAFANQPAEEYVKNFIVEKFRPRTIIIGYDHRFGKDRKGDFRMLEMMSAQMGFRLVEIPQHVLDEITISSTRIRQALLEGNIEQAIRLLGYEYFFSGTVVHGDKLGRKLGYPTANLKMNDEEKLVPADGIYAVYAQPASWHKKLKGMMSIGFRPTVDGKKRVIEVHLFDFDEEIYGQTLKVFVKKYLRQEEKYDTLDDLTRQMAKDREDSLRVL
jgi:riboflavin kinase/FMN adenylyltransferase